MAVLGKLLGEGLENIGENVANKGLRGLISTKGDDVARKAITQNADDALDKIVMKSFGTSSELLQPKNPLTLYQGSTIKGINDLDVNMAGKNMLPVKNEIREYGAFNPKSIANGSGSYQDAIATSTMKNDLDNASKYMGPFYHSSDAVFDRFDDAMLGSNTGYDNTAFGHFLTQDKDFSKKFGKNTGEYYANIQNPIIHPYMAELKYPDSEQLDKIVTEYLEATNNTEALDNFRQFVDDGTYKDLYDAYMSSLHFDGTDPYEFSDMEKPLLQDKGYDAIEIIEGLKKQLLPELDDATPVSSYAVFSGDAIRKATDIPDELKNELINSGAGRYISGVTFDKNDAKSVYDYVKLNSQPNLDSILKDISDETGFSFYGGKNKSAKSMEAKVKRKNAVGKQYSLMDMKDHARGAYQIDSLNNNEAIADFLDRMKEKVGAPLNVENVRSGMGYNGLHITWRSPDGIGFEVQVTTPEAWKVKKISDKIYDKWRNITDVTKLSKDEFRKYIKDVQYSNKLWKELNLPDLKEWENYLK